MHKKHQLENKRNTLYKGPASGGQGLHQNNTKISTAEENQKQGCLHGKFIHFTFILCRISLADTHSI